MNTIERTDKIDAYLAGTMSEAEKKEFEGLLLGSETSLEDRTKLQDEMELQKEIIFAIRRRGFREMVKKDIAEIKQEKDEHHQRIKRITIWSLGGSSVLAVAAVCLLLITVVPLANMMYDSSNVYYAQVLDAGELRGCPSDTLSILWSESVSALQQKDWSRADELALQVMGLSRLPIVGMTDDERLDFYQQAEWMHANYLMHNKRFFMAKRLLKKISSEGGRFSKQANDLIGQKK
jgi:hypothetical protein